MYHILNHQHLRRFLKLQCFGNWMEVWQFNLQLWIAQKHKKMNLEKMWLKISNMRIHLQDLHSSFDSSLFIYFLRKTIIMYNMLCDTLTWWFLSIIKMIQHWVGCNSLRPFKESIKQRGPYNKFQQLLHKNVVAWMIEDKANHGHPCLMAWVVDVFPKCILFDCW